jgi:hypothetical protein
MQFEIETGISRLDDIPYIDKAQLTECIYYFIKVNSNLIPLVGF